MTVCTLARSSHKQGRACSTKLHLKGYERDRHDAYGVCGNHAQRRQKRAVTRERKELAGLKAAFTWNNTCLEATQAQCSQAQEEINCLNAQVRTSLNCSCGGALHPLVLACVPAWHLLPRSHMMSLLVVVTSRQTSLNVSLSCCSITHMMSLLVAICSGQALLSMQCSAVRSQWGMQQQPPRVPSASSLGLDALHQH